MLKTYCQNTSKLQSLHLNFKWGHQFPLRLLAKPAPLAKAFLFRDFLLHKNQNCLECLQFNVWLFA